MSTRYALCAHHPQHCQLRTRHWRSADSPQAARLVPLDDDIVSGTSDVHHGPDEPDRDTDPSARIRAEGLGDRDPHALHQFIRRHAVHALALPVVRGVAELVSRAELGVRPRRPFRALAPAVRSSSDTRNAMPR